MLVVLTSLITGIFTDWQDRRKEQRAIESAVAQNKIRLAQDEQSHNQQWEMAALEGRDSLLRRLSFVAWSIPLVWAAFDAPGAKIYFEQSLGALPDWYVGGYLMITGAIWGVAELKAAGVFKK